MNTSTNKEHKDAPLTEQQFLDIAFRVMGEDYRVVKRSSLLALRRSLQAPVSSNPQEHVSSNELPQRIMSVMPGSDRHVEYKKGHDAAIIAAAVLAKGVGHAYPASPKAWSDLYVCVNHMVAKLGAAGEIDARSDEVSKVMDALHAIDGGTVSQRAIELHEKAFMPFDQATSLALREVIGYCAEPVSAPQPHKEAVPQGLTNYIRSLTMHVYRTHYAKESPTFENLGDAWGALSQLDNMITGLIRAPQPVTQLLNAEELTAFNRVCDCWDDGEGYDVAKPMMQRLAEIGVLRRVSGQIFEATDFGVQVRYGTPPAIECNAESDVVQAKCNRNDVSQPVSDEQILSLFEEEFGGDDLEVDDGQIISFARNLLAQSAGISSPVEPVPCGGRGYCGRFPFCGCGDEPLFPERDPNKSAEHQGLFRKFEVKRLDGSDKAGGKHQGCRYFVLDLDHDTAAPAAMRAYAAAVHATHPDLAKDIQTEFGSSPVDTKDAERRYEIIRKLNVPQFAELYRRNIAGEGRFDELVDQLGAES